MIRAARHLMLLLLVTTLAAPVACSQESGGTAVLLYISSTTTADLPVPVSRVRTSATDQLHALFTAAGRRVVPAVDLDLAVGRWRVRSDWALSAEFINGLHQELGVDQLQVAHLHAQATGLSLIVRTVDCPSGRLLSVQMPSVTLSAELVRGESVDPAPWLAALARLCNEVDPSVSAAPPGTPLVVIPAQGIGCEDDQTLTATASLLQLLLAENRWTVPDPGLATTALSRRGVATGRIGPAGHRVLREAFGSEEMLVLTLAAYGESTPSSRGDNFDDEPSRRGRSALGDFDLALRRIDLVDGEVSASGSIFAPSAPEEGWFGIVHDRSLQERIQTAAGSLWQQFSNASEDH